MFNTILPWEDPVGQDSLTDRLLLRLILRSVKATQPKMRHLQCMERVSAVKCKHGVSPDGMKAEVVPSGFPRASRHKACKRGPADVE